MPRITPKKVALLVLLLIVISGGVLTWIALETSYGQHKVAAYRAWCLTMWNSGIFHIMGGLIVIAALAILGQGGGSTHAKSRPATKRRPTPKSGPLGGFHTTEAWMMGEHYEDPWKRKAARKVRDIIKHGEF